MLDANLKSVFLYCEARDPAAARATAAARSSRVSSALGLVGGDEDFATHAYAASKAG